MILRAKLMRFWPVLLLLPMLLPLLTTDTYYLHGILCKILIFGMLVVSLDLILGYLGDVSLGHAGFFALGAYAVGILTATPDLNGSAESTMVFFPQLPFLAALAIGIGISALAGFVLAFPSLRVSGHYLAVTTLAYGLIIHHWINESEQLTNGTKGIHLPNLQLFGVRFFENSFFWIAYPSLVLVMWLVHNLTKSYWGRAIEAIKSSPVAAESCGIPRSRIKVIVFTFSAALAGFAGGLFANYDNYIGTNSFSLDMSIFAVMILIFGGVRSRLGSLIGVAFFILLPEFLNSLQEYRLTVFGVVLMLTLFFFPSGVAGIVHRLWDRFPLRHKFEIQDEPVASVELSKIAVLKPKSDEVLIEMKNVGKFFGGVKAVQKVDMNIRRGEIHGLMGPNGSGKSTTVNLISGIYPASEGRILFAGKDISDLKQYQRAEIGISRTFQNLQLFGEFTVLENVLVGLHKSFESSFAKVLFPLPAIRRQERELRARALSWLEFVGLKSEANRKASELSYGQSRRLEIARALAGNPSLLLLDEPAAGFNHTEIRELNQLILKVRDLGVTILLIEHHIDMIMEICDKVTVLNFGQKIAEGTPAEIQKNPHVISAYLGQTETEVVS